MHEENEYLKQISENEFANDSSISNERPSIRWTKQQYRLFFRLRNLRFSSELTVNGYDSLDTLTFADEPELTTLSRRNQITAQAVLPADYDELHCLVPVTDDADPLFELIPIRDRVTVFLLSNSGESDHLRLGHVRGAEPFTAYELKRPWLSALTFLLPIPQSLYELIEGRVDRDPTTSIRVDIICNAFIQSPLSLGPLYSLPKAFQAKKQEPAYLWRANVEWNGLRSD